ncbi:hypothetical protein SULI_06200 [Saccharolobus solfataricus]|nr:hypothetical protein SULB_03235 [Saccharolobus solfataricus]AYN75804.1 hypothetical protein SULC_03230 [Saccharolobus solfataricus]AYP18640.1 hypothetical protein SULA_03235 [Saccharolobus solfataricus]AZF69507.1 hypothetical protein SULG_06200 [Saccharolobus solfataricus]AZF72127.1 hypothetical protein SULH_06200 [Saccharolobus solfataricus]
MVFEESCQSCGKIKETKYCSVLKINVCYECCTLCKKRIDCNLRVWFKDLIPNKKQQLRKQEKTTLEKYF